MDGVQAASQAIPHSVPFIFPWDETFDVGVDTRTGVNDADYQVQFAFTGKLNSLKIELAPKG